MFLEDDMEIPLPEKVTELLAFPERLNQRGWNSKKGCMLVFLFCCVYLFACVCF
jgi:hypothetical protein